MTKDVRILILAAGQSSRMKGRDKLLEEVDGLPLLARQVEAALATGHSVTVALPPRPHQRYELIGLAEALEVEDAAGGMGITLAAGVRHLLQADAILILLADLPEITTSDLNHVVVEGVRSSGIVRGASADGRPGHPLFVPRILFPAFAELTGDDGGKAIVERFGAKLVRLPAQHATLDLDTPEAWTAWRASRV